MCCRNRNLNSICKYTYTQPFTRSLTYSKQNKWFKFVKFFFFFCLWLRKHFNNFIFIQFSYYLCTVFHCYSTNTNFRHSSCRSPDRMFISKIFDALKMSTIRFMALLELCLHFTHHWNRFNLIEKGMKVNKQHFFPLLGYNVDRFEFGCGTIDSGDLANNKLRLSINSSIVNM